MGFLRQIFEQRRQRIKGRVLCIFRELSLVLRSDSVTFLQCHLLCFQCCCVENYLTLVIDDSFMSNFAWTIFHGVVIDLIDGSLESECQRLIIRLFVEPWYDGCT